MLSEGFALPLSYTRAGIRGVVSLVFQSRRQPAPCIRFYLPVERRCLHPEWWGKDSNLRGRAGRFTVCSVGHLGIPSDETAYFSNFRS